MAIGPMPKTLDELDVRNGRSHLKKLTEEPRQ